MSPDGGAPGLVLASTSPYRRTLLERLGIAFHCLAPRFDEASVVVAGWSPMALSAHLAVEKATSVAADVPGATVIGCDQLVSLEGRILGKPGTVEAAVIQLQAMAGRAHELITSMVVLHGTDRVVHTDVTTMTMRALDPAAIERYVERDRPVDCAGSYKVEQGGIALFEAIETRDHTAITGLPLIALTRILRRFGHEIP